MDGAEVEPGRGGALPRIRVLTDQLWHSVDVEVDFRLGPPAVRSDPAWRTVESYWVIPSLARARMLIPAQERAATIGSLRNYRQLRAPKERLARAALVAAARVKSPLAPTTLQVRVPVTAAKDVPACLPLASIARHLGVPVLRAAIGISDRVNGKPTLQMVHPCGEPAGYAKLGWHPLTDTYVSTEAAVLQLVGGGSSTPGRMRAPRVLTAFQYGDHPLMVTEPLPLDARAVRGQVPGPSSAELYSLCPVSRRDRPGCSGQVLALRRRLAARRQETFAPAAVAAALALLDEVQLVNDLLPIAERWHGDLAPWNCARDREGTLWAWDWESSEPDTLAGLDALHWELSVRRESARSVSEIRIADCLPAASPHLSAAGVPAGHWRTVAKVYVADLVERAAALAAATGRSNLWITPTQLLALTREVDQ